jgi:putative sporulation protein YyaC
MVEIRFDDMYAVEKLCDAMKNIPWHNTTIVCVGTDRSTGDAFGPLVGSKVMERGISVPVIGTLDDTVNAVNLESRLSEVRTSHILAVDASLGTFANVEHLVFEDGPLFPGKGVKKSLSPFGDWCLTGIVNISGFLENLVLNNTRLSLVMAMADVAAQAILSAARSAMVVNT